MACWWNHGIISRVIVFNLQGSPIYQRLTFKKNNLKNGIKSNQQAGIGNPRMVSYK